MRIEAFDSTTPIDISALVQVEFATESAWFLLAPVAGGLEVTVEDTEVTVLSLDSPLGSLLVGLKSGAQISSPKAKILRVE